MDAEPRGPQHSALDVGHEASEVPLRPVLLSAFVLTMVLIFSVVVTFVLLRSLAARESKRSAPVSPLAGSYAPKAPPEPRLQTDPIHDLAALRAAEDATLHAYGWVDEQAGVVRVPIERAIELLAERGLPARPVPSPSPSPRGVR